MARPQRLEFAGAWYHVTSRGNERGDVFRDDRDREHFIFLLGELGPRYGLEIHGYVLMSNHYHLLVRLDGEKGLSAAMQWLAVSYTVWFNRRHRRAGHLFQGRFKAILVGFEGWGVELSRYLHLNPVRLRRFGLDKSTRRAEKEGLAEAPPREIVLQRLEALRNYTWSSYPAYIHLTKAPEWLHTQEVLESFGGDTAGGRERYRQHVEEAIRASEPESPWEEVKAGFVLGGEELLEKAKGMIQGNVREQPGLKKLQNAISFEDVVSAVCQLKGQSWEEFVDQKGDWGRDMALLVARKNTSLTNRELAKWLGDVDDSTVAQAVRRLQKRVETTTSLKEIYERLNSAMSYVKT